MKIEVKTKDQKRFDIVVYEDWSSSAKSRTFSLTLFKDTNIQEALQTLLEQVTDTVHHIAYHAGLYDNDVS